MNEEDLKRIEDNNEGSVFPDRVRLELCAEVRRLSLQNERHRKALEEIGRMTIYENAEAYIHQLISDALADKRKDEKA